MISTQHQDICSHLEHQWADNLDSKQLLPYQHQCYMTYKDEDGLWIFNSIYNRLYSIEENNQGTILLVNNPVFHVRKKTYRYIVFVKLSSVSYWPSVLLHSKNVCSYFNKASPWGTIQNTIRNAWNSIYQLERLICFNQSSPYPFCIFCVAFTCHYFWRANSL